MVVPNDSSKDTRTSQRRTGRTQKRSTITPSPNSHKKEEEDEEDEDEPLVRLRRDQDTKPAASKRPKRAAASTATSATTSHRTTPKNINDVLQQDARTFQLEAARLSIKKGNLKKDVDDDDDERRCVPCVSNKTNAFLPSDVSNGVAVAPRNGAHGNDHPVDDDDDDDDNDEDEDDRPFTVEYASSSRSTCRRCDAVIAKGALRISHVPLFRGKPGYRVYRHLPCAVFSEEIEKVQDVGGWNRIDPLDLEQLRQRIQDSQLELEQENEDLDPDELVQKGFQGEIRSTPLGFVGTQLPFQIEGQSWMYHQEVHVPEIRGGILADEMGMGKTIQTITALLDNRPLLQHCKPGTKHLSTLPDYDMRQREESLWTESLKEWKHEMTMNNVTAKILPKKHGGARTGTLVVCPLVALSQWKSEIEKFTEPGCLSIGIYHGPNRESEMNAEMIRKYDVVLTTYQVLEQDFRKMVSPNKVTCPNCRGKFKVDKLRVHLTYFCGAAAQRTEAQARQRRGQGRDNHNSRGGGSGGGGGSSSITKGKDQPKKFPATKVMRKGKKVIKKVDPTSSDDEVDNGNADTMNVKPSVTPTVSRRPARVASKVASKKLKSSVKEWSPQNDDDDDESSSSLFVSDSDNESSDDDNMLSDDDDLPIRVTKNKSSSHVKSIATAKQKQAEVLAKFQKGGKKHIPMKKKGPQKGKDKRFDSSDESSSEDDRDPMEGIDINALMEEAMAGSRFSFLHSFCWWRIVLDEAHFIKSRSSQTAAAAFALTSIHKWCLSGTPLQNRVGELYSLIRFLRIDPMAHYFCRHKSCTCKSIHYRMQQGRCLGCGHPSMMHFSHFNKFVLNPIQRDGYSGDGRRAMFLLRDSVLNLCLLRRTKQNRSADMNLPPRLVTIRPVRLHPVEEDFYEALYTQTKSSFDDYVAEGTLLNNYAHIFDLLTKMRQAVNHPYLIIHSKRSATREAGQRATAIANGTTDCAICHEPPTGRVASSCCSGFFCRSCVIEYLSSALGDGTPCPSCSAPFSIDLNQVSPVDSVDDGTLSAPSAVTSYSGDVPSLKEITHVQTGSILRRLNLAEFATSTKIEVLVQELIEMRRQRPGSKALVFSQFVNMLDLVRWRLHSDPCLADMGLGVCILHGGMDAKSRDAALKNFRENSHCRVLLLSLKAAGVALNLTVASECFLLDLWWNPAAELQAIDRCHRLGQHRPIRAVRFVAEGTVEERVLQLQEKKRLVFDGTVGGDAGSLKMLTVDDMKALFA